MPSLAISICKGQSDDAIEIVRADGSASRFSFPKKGPLPHDAIHLFVEDMVPFRRAFWGMIAEGAAPEAIQEIAKAGGHASAKKALEPDPNIIELIQAERIVECFEADAWGAPADCDTFRSILAAACADSRVPAPALSDALIDGIRARIAAFAMAWLDAAPGTAFGFRFETAT